MNYGLPYMGSKSRIAEWIVELLPSANNFVDLFAGGCSITHAALLSKKWKNFIINDLSDIPSLFVDAVNGKYKNETRWISREDFFKYKDTDPYIRLCWSFGNRQTTYLYGKDIEDYKRSLHEAIYEYKYERALKYGIDFSKIDDIKGVHDRKSAVRKVIFETLFKEGKVIKDGSHYFFKDRPWKNVEILQSSNQLERLQSMERIQTLQRQQNLSRLNELCNLDCNLNYIKVFQKSYENVEIPKGSIVYCDIPYKGTVTYITNDENGFDHDKFYKWANNIKHPVFISEYEMPKEFALISKREIRTTFSSTSNCTKTVECLYANTIGEQLFNKQQLF